MGKDQIAHRLLRHYPGAPEGRQICKNLSLARRVTCRGHLSSLQDTGTCVGQLVGNRHSLSRGGNALYLHMGADPRIATQLSFRHHHSKFIEFGMRTKQEVLNCSRGHFPVRSQAWKAAASSLLTLVLDLYL